MSAAFGIMMSRVDADHPCVQSLKEMMDTLAARADDDAADADGGGDGSSEEGDETDEEISIDDFENAEEEECVPNSFGAATEDENGFSESERHGMMKNKVIYVYRSETTLRRAHVEGKPIAGFVEVVDKAFQFKVVFRQSGGFVKQIVNFNDRKGKYRHSLWCAPLELGGTEEPISDFSEIQKGARLAAVAIPNSYSIGPGKSESNKYCVLTNWWKLRERDGTYRLPCLDPTLYGCKRTQEKGDNGADVVIRNGLQTGIV